MHLSHMSPILSDAELEKHFNTSFWDDFMIKRLCLCDTTEKLAHIESLATVALASFELTDGEQPT